MDIIGHQKQLTLLEKSIKRENVAQAYLFTGPENVGKFTVALDFAQRLTGNGKGLNPNLYILKPEVDEDTKKKKEIKIEGIKDLQHWQGLSSFENSFKVAIIDDAQKMNRTAQNALLKTLEEARPNTVAILVTQDEKKILPTVISRCHRMRFGNVSDEELKQGSSGEINKDVLFWSIGKPGLFKKLSEDDEEINFRRQVLAEFKEILSKNANERMKLAEVLVDDQEMAIKKMNLWLVIIRESIVSENFNEDLSDRKIDWLEKIEKSLNLITTTNANVKMVLENLLISF